jgi:hypothetical protein
MESESSMVVPHHQWVQVLVLEEGFDLSAYVHGLLVFTLFGICIYSRLPLLHNSSTLHVFIYVPDKENNQIRNKDDYFGRIIRMCAFYMCQNCCLDLIWHLLQSLWMDCFDT